MFIRAGAVSLALLLASRLLGLLRESAQAAAFGTSGLADVAVLMLTLPDWLTGVAASGALAYVLLPAWAGCTPAQVQALQRRVAAVVLVVGVVVAVAMVLARTPLALGLAPGAAPVLREAALGLAWSACALPLALLAAVWGARLQHERDFVGLYGANLVVNAVVIAAIAGATRTADATIPVLGAGLLLAMAARLGWQLWRMRYVGRAELLPPLGGGWEGGQQRSDRRADDQGPAPTPTLPEGGPALRASPYGAAVAPTPTLPPRGREEDLRMPAASLWLWAILSAGLPLALPFAARSIASAGGGEGALAAFNYAWKLVELPLILAIQLVATLALPAVAAAVRDGLHLPASRAPVRDAYALAWTLACAAAAALVVGAPAWAALLFGWGRMPAAALASIADWARIAAWGLLPQALAAVGLTVLAAHRRMAASALAYALALAVLGACAWAGVRSGAALMGTLNLLYGAIAAGVLIAGGRAASSCLPLGAMAWPLGGLAAAAALRAAGVFDALALPATAALSLAAAAAVLALAWRPAMALRRTAAG